MVIAIFRGAFAVATLMALAQRRLDGRRRAAVDRGGDEAAASQHGQDREQQRAQQEANCILGHEGETHRSTLEQRGTPSQPGPRARQIADIPAAYLTNRRRRPSWHATPRRFDGVFGDDPVVPPILDCGVSERRFARRVRRLCALQDRPRRRAPRPLADVTRVVYTATRSLCCASTLD
jgi:hypothetical protein